VCAALSPLASGRAVVLGRSLPAERRSVRRRVGFLGHANALYDDLTVTENVRFWARAAEAPPDDVEAALDRLRVERRLRDVEVAGLSAGQRRRVALAALVVRRPELWLLDEPHAGLDAGARDELDGLVREAVAGGATALFASHEIERGGALASRTVTLVGGIVADDSAHRAPQADGVGEDVEVAPAVAADRGAGSRPDRPADRGDGERGWRGRLGGRRTSVA
jgi:ABC-type multidrug transport system ATPase subunit